MMSTSEYLKEKVSVSLDVETVDWLDEMVKKKIFGSRSHGIEMAVSKLKESIGGK